MAAIPCIDNPVVQGLIGKCQDDAPRLFGNWIAAIISTLLIVGTIWTLFQLFLGGLQWISSSGNTDNLQRAQGRIREATIGLIILLSSWAIYVLFLNWLGVGTGSGNGIEFNFPTL